MCFSQHFALALHLCLWRISHLLVEMYLQLLHLDFYISQTTAHYSCVSSVGYCQCGYIPSLSGHMLCAFHMKFVMPWQGGWWVLRFFATNELWKNQRGKTEKDSRHKEKEVRQSRRGRDTEPHVAIQCELVVVNDSRLPS